jgi:hypothetical protein
VRGEAAGIGDLDVLTHHQVQAYLKELRIKAKLEHIRSELEQKLARLREQKLNQALGQTGLDLSGFTNIRHGRVLSKQGEKYFVHLTKDLPLSAKRLA